jgi:Fur family iron response transcriptional regulator
MKDVVRKLIDFEISPTQQRVEIASVLLAKPQHLSAEQVMRQVNRERAVASKATIYNTLGLFASKGLIREVIVDPDKIFYDSNVEPHHHFYHVESGQLTDIALSDLKIDRLPEAPADSSVESVEVIVRLRSKSDES